MTPIGSVAAIAGYSVFTRETPKRGAGKIPAPRFTD